MDPFFFPIIVSTWCRAAIAPSPPPALHRDTTDSGGAGETAACWTERILLRESEGSDSGSYSSWDALGMQAITKQTFIVENYPVSVCRNMAVTWDVMAASSELLDALSRFWLTSAKRQLWNSIMTIVLTWWTFNDCKKWICKEKGKRKVLYRFQMNLYTDEALAKDVKSRNGNVHSRKYLTPRSKADAENLHWVRKWVFVIKCYPYSVPTMLGFSQTASRMAPSGQG